METGGSENPIRVAADASPNPLWASYTSDFLNSSRDALPHSENIPLGHYREEQLKHPPAPGPCPLGPSGARYSTRAQKKCFRGKPGEYETHKEPSQEASQHVGSGFCDMSPLLFSSWVTWPSYLE